MPMGLPYQVSTRRVTFMSSAETTTRVTAASPYAFAVDVYRSSGLGYPIPSFQPDDRRMPVNGFTGRHGAIPADIDHEGWKVTHADHQVLLRVPKDRVGIDVDAYGEKHGALTLTRIEATHGKLPATVRSSARGDADIVSGIRFFLLESDMDQSKMHDPGGHIEVIRFDHRFAVVSPSWNEKARATYQWYGPDDARLVDTSQLNVTNLSMLPRGWYEHLVRSCSCFEIERKEYARTIRKYVARPKGLTGERAASVDVLHGLDVLATMPEGGRNNFLSRLAGRTLLFDVWIARALDYDDVIDVLRETALTAGLEEQEVDRTLASAEQWAADRYETEKAVAS